MEDLIEWWKKLNTKANGLLEEHVSFKKYNGVRVQMDKIEKILLDKYEIDIYKLVR